MADFTLEGDVEVFDMLVAHELGDPVNRLVGRSEQLLGARELDGAYLRLRRACEIGSKLAFAARSSDQYVSAHVGYRDPVAGVLPDVLHGGGELLVAD